MTAHKVYIGVDVSKETLEVFIPDGDMAEKGTSRQIGNKRKEIRALIRKVVSKHPAAMFCCEATGGYERNLLVTCHDESAPACVMNAQQVHHFARHRGVLEKNDRIDARIISLAAADKKPQPHSWLDSAHRERKELWSTREALKKESVRLKNMLEHLEFTETKVSIRKAIRTIERQMEVLESRCEALLLQDGEWASIAERWRLVSGIGIKTILSVASLMPEIKHLSGKECAKMVGVAPLCDQSGKRDNPRQIAGGRYKVRIVLYWAAISASRHNHVLSEFYQRLLKTGKSKKQALIAVARKLLVLMCTIAQDPDFVPMQG